jgi:hypothetical protein
MASTPIVPQHYQERFLTALQDGSRLETSSERWNRERNESLKRWNDAINSHLFSKKVGPLAAAAFARHYTSQPTQWRPLTCRTDPTIGRKRRARRARGRRRHDY